MGYRGFFDIDFVVSEKGTPYVIETNMRRTGGTHAYDTAKHIFGNNWNQTAFVLSRDNFQYGKEKLSPKKILERMKHVLYPIRDNREGVIISIVNRCNPSFGFVILANNKNRVLYIYKQMQYLWG